MLINAFGLFVHYWYLFVIIAQGMTYLIFYLRDRDNKSLLKFILYNAITGIPFALLWLPSMILQLENGANTWMHVPGLWEIPASLSRYLGGNLLGTIIIIAVVVLALFNRNGGIKVLSRSESLNTFFSRKQAILFSLFMFAIIIPWLVSQFQPIFIERYTIIGLPVFAVYMGSVLSRSKLKKLAGLFGIALLVAVVFGLYKHRTRPITKSDKLATYELIDRSEKGDIIIFCSLSRPAAEYYLLQEGLLDSYERYSFPAELEFHPSWRDVAEMMSRKDELSAEAEELAASISATAAGKSVWVYYGGDFDVDVLLKKELDENLKLENSYDLGAKEIFFTDILQYRNPSAN